MSDSTYVLHTMSSSLAAGKDTLPTYLSPSIEIYRIVNLALQDLVGDNAKVNRWTMHCGFWIDYSTIDLHFSSISNTEAIQALVSQQNESMLSALRNC